MPDDYCTKTPESFPPEEIPEEEMVAEPDDDEMEDPGVVFTSVEDLEVSSDFLAAVKRVLYGVESLFETVPELFEIWGDEIKAINDDVEEARQLWPGKEGC